MVFMFERLITCLVIVLLSSLVKFSGVIIILIYIAILVGLVIINKKSQPMNNK